MKPAAAKIKAWRENPPLYVYENFQVTPDKWQEAHLWALVDRDRLGLKACKGPGKTCVLSWDAWWFMSCFPMPKLAATSISGANLQDGLWTEMAKWRARSQFLTEAFEWQKSRIYAKDHPERWWMSARTWRDGADSSQQANTLAGLHEDYMMFLIDEAGGVPDAVMSAAEGALATGKVCKIIMAGNPTHLSGPLYRAATREAHLWHMISITGDPDDPMRSPRVSIKWAREQIEKYGKDNPWVMVNVFGQFPPSSLNVLLGPNDVEKSMGRHLTEDKYAFSQKRLGVDVARFGDDRTIIFPRQGLAAFNCAEMRGADGPQIAARLAKARNRWLENGTNDIIELIDCTGGFGASAYDAYRVAGYSPIDVQFGGKAIDPRYENKRAEMWFEMAEWVKRGGALPDDPELQKELTAPTYTFNKHGKFLIEPKDQIKARLGFSPDKADALVTTFALPEKAANGSGIMPNRGNHHASDTEYDPFRND